MAGLLDLIKARYSNSDTPPATPNAAKVADRYAEIPIPKFDKLPTGQVKMSVDEKWITSNTTPKTVASDAGVTLPTKVAAGVAQSLPRSVGSSFLELANLGERISGGPVTRELQIRDEVGKLLFGSEPIKAISQQEPEWKDLAVKAGIPEKTATGLAPILAVGFTLADFTAPGGKKKAVEEGINLLANKHLGEEGVKFIDDISSRFFKGEVNEKQLATELSTKFSDTPKMYLDNIISQAKTLRENGATPGNMVKAEIALLREANPQAGFLKVPGLETSIKESPDFSDTLKSRLSSTYNPLKNEQTLKQANDLITSNFNGAISQAEDVSKPATALTNALRLSLIKKYDDEGNIEAAVRLAEIAASHGGTTPGQAIQVLATMNRLSPEGILLYTQRQIQKVNKTLSPGNQVKLTDELARELTDDAKRIAVLDDGEEKAVQTALMLKKVTDLFPTSIAKKIATYQTIAQLVNPKTFIRNLGGNLGFATLEQTTDVFAAALDTPLSLLTGKRSTTIPSLITQAKGFEDGLRQGIRDSLSGIDTWGAATQFDIPKTNVFKGTVGQSAEKVLNVTLKAPDRAFFQAAYDGSLYKQMKAAGVLEPTEEMKEIAFHDGLYRTFQDDTALSKAFTGLKNTLNLGQEFGMGDIVLKYPKTPANLLNRGLAYSPAGFAKVIYEASKPLLGKSFDQKTFVESFSRALLGSGMLVGTGALLHRLGIITGKVEKDKDIRAIQQEVGLGQYRINVSALKRFALSGMDPETAKLQEGDALVSYDWFQPSAIPISIGANIDEGADSDTLSTVLIESLANGVNTIAEQPLISNLTRILKYGEASDVILKSAQQIPPSMVPTLLNQIRQLTDDTKRNVYDPSYFQYAFNLARNKVPFASKTLEPMVGPFGKDQLVYPSGNNNFFNVFFNPAFKSNYTTTPEARMVLSLFEDTGETKQAPRIVNTSQTVTKVKDGKLVTEKIKLSPEQVTQLQRFVGTMSRNEFHRISTIPGITAVPKNELIKELGNLLTDIGQASKIVVLGDIPKTNPGQRVLNIIAQFLGQR